MDLATLRSTLLCTASKFYSVLKHFKVNKRLGWIPFFVLSLITNQMRTFYASHSRLWKNLILQFGHLWENVSEAQYLDVSVVLAIATNSDLAKNIFENKLLILSTTDMALSDQTPITQALQLAISNAKKC